jgi:hypothetical protein
MLDKFEINWHTLQEPVARINHNVAGIQGLRTV